jgi:lipopolysaccharide/colanic/teichoic acid biosynthesis glycosyltransferase
MDPLIVPASKRVFDILASSLVMAFLSPIILFLLMLFVIEMIFILSSRGPLFYKETRISQGKPFVLWKVRVFKIGAIADAKATGVTIHTKTLEHDRKNLTFVGALLRQIYMDEIPQLYSVLVGDMSFVGPRPTNPENYEQDMIKGFQAKKILKAGLTGTFQTHKHVKYNLNQEKVDMEYALFCKTATGLQIVFHDLYILLQTVVTVLRAEGL